MRNINLKCKKNPNILTFRVFNGRSSEQHFLNIFWHFSFWSMWKPHVSNQNLCCHACLIKTMIVLLDGHEICKVRSPWSILVWLFQHLMKNQSLWVWPWSILAWFFQHSTPYEKSKIGNCLIKAVVGYLMAISSPRFVARGRYLHESFSTL